MNILITGKTGYIANSIRNWLIRKTGNVEIDCLSIRSHSLDSLSLSKYETIIHTAALVHKKESLHTKEDYFETNYELTVKLAQQAKNSGVRHFIFLSTMSVFGLVGQIGSRTVVDSNTPLKPNTFYGESKLAAERELLKMQEEGFKVAIIRPPMVYGPNSPGNYGLLSKLAKKTPIFPYIQNERSMIFIDNLCEFIKLVVEDQAEGVYHPQNQNYVSTVELVREIAHLYQKKIFFSKVLGFGVNTFFRKMNVVNKVFGSLVYSQDLSSYRKEYQVVGLTESVRKSEGQ